MGCCFSSEDEDTGVPNERSALLGRQRETLQQPVPQSGSLSTSSSHLTKTDEESALNRILQRTANDVIDVTYMEPHSLERSELVGRTRDYQAQMASLSRVKKSSALPNSDQPPQMVLSKELPATADLNFLTEQSEATKSAVDSMEVKHGEPLVVQFSTP